MLLSASGRSLSGPSSLAPAAPDYRRRRAATAMEYLFVISLIVIVSMTGINYFAQETKQTFMNSSTKIEKATDGKKAP